MATEKENSATLDLGIPSWATILPLIGLGAGLYYAHSKKGNVGQYLIYASIGAWATSVPLVFYVGKSMDKLTGGMRDEVKKQLTETKPATPVVPEQEPTETEVQ